MSFVSKATLWERGLCHHNAHERPHHPPFLCPRFLSHMKARPEDLKPPCYLSSNSRLRPPSQRKATSTHTLTAPRTQTLEGFFHLAPDRKRNIVQTDASLITGRHSAVVVPCPPLPATPPSSTINPTPPRQNTPQPDSRGQQIKPNSVPASPSHSPPAHEEMKDDVQERETQPAAVSVADEPVGLECSPSPVSVVSDGSLSNLSRPPSSLFSRSTDLASGRSSVLSADIGDSDPGGRLCLSPLQPSLVTQSPVASHPPAGSNSHRSSMNTASTPGVCEPLIGQSNPPSPRPASCVPPQSDKPPSRHERTNTTNSLHQDPDAIPSFESDHGLITLAFPSATWSSCPSPHRTTLCSGSGPKLTPPASATRLESQHWPVLPPISPVRGRCGTAASRSSELSCSQSHVFDELEAIAPRSTSCPSLDEPSDSSGRPSPDTELSPGLAALTVGCDSGNLGSLSRVQLLLIDRLEPETPLSPFGQEEEQDWSDLRMEYDPRFTSADILRPLTAGGISERCDSPGKVHENKSDQSEGGSGSPSSWIIDHSPSYDMFRSTSSPCDSDNASSSGHRGFAEEDSSYPGCKDEVESSAGGRRYGSLDRSAEVRDRRMEERKTKALSMLSKLQVHRPRQANGTKGCSNFEDFDFLAKYCIFNQEKLAEYKRAFEAEDTDGDGYISCLQVLLALKNIIPAELLSDEEEIYVYRILEMVDFRVTDGLVDLRLFAVISSLAQKIATMDEFMRSLISDMDFRSLEVRLFKAKQLFLFLLEDQRGDVGPRRGFISAEQLLLELKAGGIHLEQEAAVRLELQHIPPLDLLDFLAYLPLFMLIHKSIIANPLNDSSDL